MLPPKIYAEHFVMHEHLLPCLSRMVYGADGHCVHPIDCEGPMCPVWDTHGLLEHHQPHAPQLSSMTLPYRRQTAREWRQRGLQQYGGVSVASLLVLQCLGTMSHCFLIYPGRQTLQAVLKSKLCWCTG